MLPLLLGCATTAPCDTIGWLSDSICEGHSDGWHLLAMQPGAIYEVDPADGQTTLFLETDWDDGMFTADVRADGVAFSSNETLYEVDHCQGRRAAVAEMSTKIQGMAFDSSGRLLGMSRHEDMVVTINVETGFIDPLYFLDFDLGYNGMAYDPVSQTIYGLDADSGTIFVVDPLTGAPSDFVSVQDGVAFDYVGMAYSPDEGGLWVSTGTELYTLDPTTGAVDLIGSHGEASGVNDLALFPPCP